MDFWCFTFPMLVLTIVFAFDSLVKDMKINKLEQQIRTLETLYAAHTESYSVIAKAFRNNPKDLVLKEYMMKNACCCEAEEGE
jgi:hypothetical protein